MPFTTQTASGAKIIRLGFVPLIDCAPLAVAQETGIFKRRGLHVELSRELGWASVRDKLIYGHLDAAQSIAGIAITLGLGINEMRCDVAVPMILNLHGNAITLSTEISHKEIGRGEGLKRYLTHQWKKERPFTLAVTHRYSSHHTLLKSWLSRYGVLSPEQVEIIFLPPPLMARSLAAGHIDGYCVGEPWNSESIMAGTGWCPVTSSEISRGHPEKVLVLSGSFLADHREASIALVASLLEACQLCESAAFRNDLISILAKKTYTNTSEDILRNSLGPLFNTGVELIDANGMHIFHGDTTNRPSMEKASRILAELRHAGAIPEGTCGALSRIFREDLFHAAEQVLHEPVPA
jgi:ABC-type nitrate/sulfonate/bicarbonate transport system substrate-binding protein